MWHAELSRQELLELCLGGTDPEKVRSFETALLTPSNGNFFDAYWIENPRLTPGLPALIVTPDDELVRLMTAISASPQAPIPFTALCRVLTREEANHFVGDSMTPMGNTMLSAMAVLSMVEAILHSDGKLSLKTIGPATCRRTVSFAWAKATAIGVPTPVLESLLTRWLKTYSLVSNSPASFAIVSETVSVLMDLLEVTISRDKYSSNGDYRYDLVEAIMSKDSLSIERAWLGISADLGLQIPLTEIAASSREERGGVLQQALRIVSSNKSSQAALVACAFLATQVAPRSLEHLEILRTTSKPEMVLWYAFLATIQSPVQILGAQGGLGFRIVRDIKRIEEHLSLPTADIAFQELQVISKLGLETIARRLGHSGEIEVELVPLVTATFSFPSRSQRAEIPETAAPAPIANPSTELTNEQRSKIYDALNTIAAVIEARPQQLPLISPQAPPKKSYRKKSV